MSAIPRDLVRKQPAHVVYETDRRSRTIDGELKRRVGGGELFLWFLLATVMVLFAGFLLNVTTA